MTSTLADFALLEKLLGEACEFFRWRYADHCVELLARLVVHRDLC